MLYLRPKNKSLLLGVHNVSCSISYSQGEKRVFLVTKGASAVVVGAGGIDPRVAAERRIARREPRLHLRLRRRGWALRGRGGLPPIAHPGDTRIELRRVARCREAVAARREGGWPRANLGKSIHWRRLKEGDGGIRSVNTAAGPRGRTVRVASRSSSGRAGQAAARWKPAR